MPAGALAASTAIAVDQSGSGSPPLVAGMSAFGAIYAVTPHGTTFTAPVTVTVPFAASVVPAGAAPALFKTNAAGAWEPLLSATVNAGTMSAEVTSFSWLIVGTSPPQITTQPTDLAVTEPATATFAVTAIGFYTPFTFQWQKSDDGGATFVDIGGATASSYTTGATAVVTDDGDRYRVRVSSSGGSSTSAAATLAVSASIIAPSITTHPVDAMAGVGGSATFTVVAAGTSPAYQWQRSNDGGSTWTDIAGATNASYTLAVAQATDGNARFRARVSNAAATVFSNAATLTVPAASGSLVIDAFEIAGPPPRLPPPTQTGQFGSFAPAAAVTCSLHPTIANLLQFSAISAAGTQGGSLALNYDTLTKEVQSVGYSSNSTGGTEFRYLCLVASPAPQIRSCTGLTVDEARKTFTFVDAVLDFEAPSFIVPTPSDVRLNGTLNVPTCFP